MGAYGSLTAINVYEQGSYGGGYTSIVSASSDSESEEEEKRLDDELVETLRGLPHVNMVSPVLNINVLVKSGIYEGYVEPFRK